MTDFASLREKLDDRDKENLDTLLDETLSNNCFGLSSELLDLIASFLVNPCLTNTVIKYHRPLLIELTARALLLLQTQSTLTNTLTSTTDTSTDTKPSTDTTPTTPSTSSTTTTSTTVSIMQHPQEWWSSRYFDTLNNIDNEKHDKYDSSMNEINLRNEYFIAAISIILPNLPQIIPFATCFMQNYQSQLDTLLLSFCKQCINVSCLFNSSYISSSFVGKSSKISFT